MADLQEMAAKYRTEGYSEKNADARVCQDIVLKAIEKSELGKNVTIKGGVVMRKRVAVYKDKRVEIEWSFGEGKRK